MKKFFTISTLTTKLFDKRLESPVFIWGAPRSGTTLLSKLLSQHPDVGYPKNKKNMQREGTDFWWKVVGEYRGIIPVDLATPENMKLIRQGYRKILEQQAKFRLLDKIPFMVLWVPFVDKVFPDAKHIHIIRDGRAVVHSIVYRLRFSEKAKDLRFKQEQLLFGPHPPELQAPLSLPLAQRHVKQWMLLVEHGRKQQDVLHERYYEVRYEELVQEPREHIKRILQYAELTWDDEFIHAQYPEVLTNMNYKWKIPDSHADVESLLKNNQKRSPDDIEAHQKVYAEELPYFDEMNPMLQELGYR